MLLPAGDTPSRRRILTCRPAGPQDEEPCARRILTTLARRAYRRPVSAADVNALMAFYKKGREGASFERGITDDYLALLAEGERMVRGR